MRIAVVSCWKYRDAWPPFFKLLDKFWPDCPYEDYLVTDTPEGSYPDGSGYGGIFVSGAGSWCGIVADFADKFRDEPILLLQEDFFLNAPVNSDMVNQALTILRFENVGSVRLYPCPGATEPCGQTYGPVARYSRYRNSLQATIWKPEYLKSIAARFKTPSEFEIQGSEWASDNLQLDVWAFNREVQPWPISYICSAISRGQWEPGALELCKQHGIDVDLSLRPVRDLQLTT